MKILSLFDGISCARVALERAGIPVEVYFASEIDKYAMQVSQKNYSDIQQIGSVTSIRNTEFTGIKIDLLIGGSPCQDLSIAKKDRKGLDGERSGLFWEYVRILKEVKPKYFILENVASMTKVNKQNMLKAIQEIEPNSYLIEINAKLVSAQNRNRIFITNIPNVKLPKDREIFFSDIVQDFDPKYELSKITESIIYRNFGKAQKTFLHFKESISLIEKMSYPSRINQILGEFKIPTLTAGMGCGGNNVPVITHYGKFRKLTPIECERLQGLPDNYTEGISNTQRYKCLGNAFNVDVVSWILSFIPRM